MTWQQHLRKSIKHCKPVYQCKQCGYETNGEAPHATFGIVSDRSVLVGGQLKSFQNHMAANHGVKAEAMINEFNALFEGE
jgi:hypothetical protein